MRKYCNFRHSFHLSRKLRVCGIGLRDSQYQELHFALELQTQAMERRR